MKILKFKNSEGKYEDLYDTYKPDPYAELINGYEYVDMGEAGIWAKYPLGVTGWNEDSLNTILYFAWGETVGYTKSQAGVDKQFTWDDYKFKGRSANNSQSKYNKNDNKTILDLEDDAAASNMGGSWRMPTKDEFNKLINVCNTEWVINYNNITGLNGRLFTLKSDSSKEIFVPDASSCNNGSFNNPTVPNYYYWSSSLNTSQNFSSSYLYGSNGTTISVENYGTRYYGFPVLGILEQ